MGFHGGAHVATFSLIKALAERGVNVDVLAVSVPRKELDVYRQIAEIRRIGAKKGMLAKVARRAGMFVFGNWPLCQFENLAETVQWLEGHDAVCCISEVSPLRWLVASLGARCRKVQLIHTDYIGWTQTTPQSRSVTRFDSLVYSKMDCIGIVGRRNAIHLKERFPQLADRIWPFYNLIDVPRNPNGRQERNKRFTIATVGRPNWGPQKKTEFSVEVAAELKKRGRVFDWTVYGNGPGNHVARLKDYARKLGVADCFRFAGFTENVLDAVRNADVMALFSAYEGCANSIYESLLCGTPVVASDVGCAAEQIQDNVTGRVVHMDVREVADVIESLIDDGGIVSRWKKNLLEYKYDNVCALNGLIKLLGGESA